MNLIEKAKTLGTPVSFAHYRNSIICGLEPDGMRCVGGLCLAAREPLSSPFPGGHELAGAIERWAGKNHFAARREALNIIHFNENGNFDMAWKAAEEAFQGVEDR